MKTRKIGIDVSYWYPKSNRGIGTMTEKIVQNLRNSDQLQFSLYSNHFDREVSDFCDKHSFSYYVIPVPFVLYEQIMLPLVTRIKKIDLFHFLGNTGSIIIKPAPISIITLCDTIFWEKSVIHWLLHRKFGNAYRSIIATLQKRIDYSYSFISNHTKACYLQSSDAQVPNKVIYLSGGADDAKFQKNDQFLHSYICAMGASDPRKNTSLIIRSFIQNDIYRRHNLNLKIFGLEDIQKFVSSNNLDQELLRDKGIMLMGYIDDIEKKYLLQNSSGFVYLSKSEGFGIPIIEAEKLGKMCFVSKTTSCGEIAGPYSILVDPEDTDAVTSGLDNFCAAVKDTPCAENIARKIINNANRFSWKKTATETIEFYTRLLN